MKIVQVIRLDKTADYWSGLFLCDDGNIYEVSARPDSAGGTYVWECVDLGAPPKQPLPLVKEPYNGLYFSVHLYRGPDLLDQRIIPARQVGGGSYHQWGGIMDKGGTDSLVGYTLSPEWRKR